ncbi:hypothetical protein ACHAWF_003176, partial [Thalassiosira exigua]
MAEWKVSCHFSFKLLSARSSPPRVPHAVDPIAAATIVARLLVPSSEPILGVEGDHSSSAQSQKSPLLDEEVDHGDDGHEHEARQRPAERPPPVARVRRVPRIRGRRRRRRVLHGQLCGQSGVRRLLPRRRRPERLHAADLGGDEPRRRRLALLVEPPPRVLRPELLGQG